MRSAPLLICAILACHRAPAVSKGPTAVLKLFVGAGQSGVVGKELPKALELRATDGRGVPVEGQIVTFHVTAGGGSMFAGASITNSDGIAKDRWTLGTSTSEAQTVEARAVDSITGEGIVFATFTATPLPDAAASVSTVGDGEASIPGGTVQIGATVVDQYGNPVTGESVTWTASGTGRPGAATTVTDAAGVTTNTWVLGSEVGRQSMLVAVGALTSSVTAWARVPSQIVFFGNGYAGGYPLAGEVGLPLRNQPRLCVSDAHGEPVPDAPVKFDIVAGGGSVQADERTDQTGCISYTWTLGAETGLNILTASVGALTAELDAFGNKTVENLTPSIYSPNPYAFSLQPRPPLVDQKFTVIVDAGADAQSVVASANGVSVALTYGPAPTRPQGCWSGMLDLGSSPAGPYPLVATATSSAGLTATAVVMIRLDRPPVLALTPADGTIVRTGIVHVHVACVDDDPGGCTSLEYSVGNGPGRPAGTGVSVIDTDVDVSSSEGKSVPISATATDSGGNKVSATHYIYVESSTQLSVVADVGGTPLDVSASRILSADASGLHITDLAAGTRTDIDSTPGAKYVGRFVSTGVIFSTGAGVFEWRNGAVSPLPGVGFLATAGSFALLSGPLALRNFDAATTTSVSVTRAESAGVDLAANGDVVYSAWTYPAGPSLLQVRRWRAGGDVQLSKATTSGAYRPVTDGTDVVYEEDGRIVLNDGSTETVLAGTDAYTQQYELAGHFVAYVRYQAGSFNVFRHTTTSTTDEKLISTIDDSILVSMAPDGTVIFQGQLDRYRAVPGQAIQRIGSALGRVVYRDATFYVLLGTSVLKVLP